MCSRVKVPDPKFSSQTKDKLVSSEVRPVVESIVNDDMQRWFEEHPQEARRSSESLRGGRSPRSGAPRAGTDRAKGRVGHHTLCPASWLTARSATPTLLKSSWSRAIRWRSAKQGRDRKFQAILPLRGKILNVERARFDKMLAVRRSAR